MPKKKKKMPKPMCKQHRYPHKVTRMKVLRKKRAHSQTARGRRA